MALCLRCIFLSILVLLLVSACGDDTLQSTKKVVRPVKYITISAVKENKIRSFSGISKAATTSRVSFRVSGKLEKIFVKEGVLIKRGSLIASLDNSDAMLQYKKVQSSLNKSKVYQDTARSNLSRIKGLYENNNISLNEYEAAREKLANSESAYTADKNSMDLKKKELGYFSVYAPIAGMISGIVAQTGENVSSGQVILEILTMDEIEVEAGIPDSYISQIKKNDHVFISFRSLKNKKFDGKITEVSYNIDANSNTYPVSIRVLNPSDAIRPGMPATIAFDFGSKEAKKIILVPIPSVGQDDLGNFVFLVEKRDSGLGVVEKTKIKIGRMTTEGFEVIEGLKSGDMVVTAGISYLTSGLEVRMQ